MKKVSIILLVFLALLGMIVLYNNLGQRRVLARLVSLNTENINELYYKLNMFGIIPVGEAVILKDKLEEYQGRKVFHLAAFAFTNKLFGPFFSGRAEIDSFVDTVDFNPVMFRQNLFVKNEYNINKKVFYDQKLGIMTLAGVKRVIPLGTKDPLSALLFIRHASPEGLKEFDISINTNQKTYSLSGKGGIENKTINNTPYQLIKLKADIKRRDKNPYHRSSVSMLLVRVRENIPFKIDVFAGGVFLEAVLVDIK